MLFKSREKCSVTKDVVIYYSKSIFAQFFLMLGYLGNINQTSLMKRIIIYGEVVDVFLIIVNFIY